MQAGQKLTKFFWYLSHSKTNTDRTFFHFWKTM